MKLRGFLAASVLIALTAVPGAAQTNDWAAEAQQSTDLTSRGDYAGALPHARRAADLAAADDSAPFAEKITLFDGLARIEYFLGDYPAAQSAAERALHLRESFEGPPAIAEGREDVAELLDLQGKFREAASLHREAATQFKSPFAPRGDPGSGAAIGSVQLSVVDFYDPKHREDLGYGRYTYLVLVGDSNERNIGLLSALFNVVSPAWPATPDPNRAIANVFELPVLAGRRDVARLADHDLPAVRIGKVAGYYDFGAARDLLAKACVGYRSESGKACNANGRGPFFITLSKPMFVTLSNSRNAAPMQPYLVVDLSSLHEKAFPYFIKAEKERVLAQNIADGERIRATEVAVLNITLIASDWLASAPLSVRDIVGFAPSK